MALQWYSTAVVSAVFAMTLLVRELRRLSAAAMIAATPIGSGATGVTIDYAWWTIASTLGLMAVSCLGVLWFSSVGTQLRQCWVQRGADANDVAEEDFGVDDDLPQVDMQNAWNRYMAEQAHGPPADANHRHASRVATGWTQKGTLAQLCQTRCSRWTIFTDPFAEDRFVGYHTRHHRVGPSCWRSNAHGPPWTLSADAARPVGPRHEFTTATKPSFSGRQPARRLHRHLPCRAPTNVLIGTLSCSG